MNIKNILHRTEQREKIRRTTPGFPMRAPFSRVGERRRAIPSKVNKESAESGQVGEALQDLDCRENGFEPSLPFSSLTKDGGQIEE